MLRYPILLTAIGSVMFSIGGEDTSQIIQVITKVMIGIVSIGWVLWLGTAVVEIKERLGGR
jgi:hypothetical protein